MKPTHDWLYQSRAEDLCALIHDYWARQGYDVRLWVEPIQAIRAIAHHTGGAWAVRSDLVNGFPRRKLAAAA